MKTTLQQIRDKTPRGESFDKLLKNLENKKVDEKPLSIITILDSNGLDDALWYLIAVKGYDREIRLYGVWCARQAQHLITDKRSIAAIDIAERFAKGQATRQELEDAKYSALDAAWTPAWNIAFNVTSYDAWDAAFSTANSAARAIANAHSVHSEKNALFDAVRSDQEKHLRELCESINNQGKKCIGANPNRV
jgi:hypothetical protein